MRALVTGGAGFIGSHISDALLKKGAKVRVVDNLFTGNIRNIAHHIKAGKIEFFRGDIRNAALMRRALKGVDVVFHQAAYRSVPKSVEDPLGFNDVNVTATLQLFHLAYQAKVKRVVYASSSSVYGESPEPQSESMLTIPL